MIPMLPRSGNYLEDCEDDRLRAEQLKDNPNILLKGSLYLREHALKSETDL